MFCRWLLHWGPHSDNNNCLIICICNFSICICNDWGNSVHFISSLNFWDTVFRPSHVTNLLPVTLISSKMFFSLSDYFLVLLTFKPFVASVLTFLRPVVAINFKITLVFTWNVFTHLSWNMFSMSCCKKNMGLWDLEKYSILFHVDVTVSHFFWNVRCISMSSLRIKRFTQ